ncbi:MAG: Prochlorococcus phage [Cyanobacteriota bacterium]
MSHPVHRRPVLSEQDCRQWTDTILSLEHHWLQRAPGVDFYTLGAASYLDGPWDGKAYSRARDNTNQLLASSFRGLYRQTCTALSTVLGAVEFHPRLAMPGFHVFAAKPGQQLLGATAEFARRGGSVHFDLQHKLHASLWQEFEHVDWSSPLSFTLALALPASGGGLRIWPTATATATTTEPLAPSDPVVDIDYRIGELIYFTEPLLHQIAPAVALQPGDQRMTLQGHGLHCDGTWILYF